MGLPDEREKRFCVRLEAVVFAPYDRALLGTVAVPVADHDMHADAGPVTVGAHDMQLACGLGIMPLSQTLSHGLSIL